MDSEQATDKSQISAQLRKTFSLSPSIITGIVGVADVLIIIGVGLGFYLGYVGWSWETAPLYFLNLISNTLLTVGMFYFSGLYEFESILAPGRRFGKLVAICTLVFMIMVVWVFALKIAGDFSRVWFFSCLVAETGLIILFRVALKAQIRIRAQAGEIVRRIAIVGGTEQAVRFIDTLQDKAQPWNDVIGVFDDRLVEDRSIDQISGVPVLGTLKDLVDLARRERIDDIVIALPWSVVERTLSLIGQLRVLPVNIHLACDMIPYQLPNKTFSNFAGVSVLNAASKPMADWKVIQKTCEDKFFGIMALILFGPLMAIIAIIIKLESKGPVFFKQDRYGFNNEQFSVYKFRSMRHERPEDIGVPQATKNDSRVTPVGRFLRRSSLDELPQLFNVIKGEMSMVGPRPHAVAHNEQYAELIKDYFARHRVKPGITGLAQVNGWRGETDTLDKMEGRVRYDIEYIENWSIWLDIEILIKTVFVVFKSENAH